MENKEIKYYAPKIEDLFIGYKCERRVIKPNYVEQYLYEWRNYTIDNNYFGVGYENGYDWAYDEVELRTKFLDQLDIESLGWEYNKENKSYTKYLNGQFESFIYTLKHIKHQNAIHITLTYISPNESFENETYFKGKCTSINELIHIQRLLEIE